jgi:hypothetical protein
LWEGGTQLHYYNRLLREASYVTVNGKQYMLPDEDDWLEEVPDLADIANITLEIAIQNTPETTTSDS